MKPSIAIALLLTFAGCWAPTDSSSTKSSATKSEDKFRRLLDNCEKGEKERSEALEFIMSNDISRLFLNSTSECINMSEGAFAGASDKEAIQLDAIQLSQKLKMLAFYCLEIGDNSIRGSDSLRATQLYGKAAEIGAELSSKKRLLLFQSLGGFISKEAGDRIANQAKEFTR